MISCGILKAAIKSAVDYLRDYYLLKLKKQMPIDLYRRPFFKEL